MVPLSTARVEDFSHALSKSCSHRVNRDGVVFAKWAVQILSGIFLLLSFLITYRHNARVRASDLLLELEEHFNTLGSKLAFLEYK